MPTRDSYRYIYVAAFPGHVKIGITVNPAQREMQLRRYGSGARMVRIWEHENPHAVELMCRDEWHMRRTHLLEEFNATPLAAIRLVQRMMRAYSDGDRPHLGWRRNKPNARRLAQRRAAAAGIAQSTIRKYWKAEQIARARSGKRNKIDI